MHTEVYRTLAVVLLAKETRQEQGNRNKKAEAIFRKIDHMGVSR
jgi:hypothetical protein